MVTLPLPTRSQPSATYLSTFYTAYMPPNTTSETKAQILILKKFGHSDRAIAQALGNVHYSTVNRIARAYANGRPTTEKAPRSGRPRILTPKDVRFAALALTRSKPATAAAIKRTFFPHSSIPTLRRYLRKLGLRSFRRRRVPLLKWKHRKARLGWSRNRLLWTQAQWDDIVFSDETRIELFGPDGANTYWRYPHQSPFDP
ncbi:Transposable element Tcb2 transposase [Ceratobasidium theobromae]|uniref:Transposable element Tcb2 transposase n=1 Tax=Ceratobasidium theobromae TaxID=1582974 RepID=A0A5N5Q8L2_9AGAM|nr:Transposable element Tcb2 transposase [Ceratobasidium theobromae]